jgi:3-phenylpropionate/cinnamic acid dioxygenase small subunit
VSDERPPAAPPVAVAETLRREIEAFIHFEARLADESRYAEWEALVTDDMHYWVPSGAADYDPAGRLSYINDNRSRLATRIRQLSTGLRHAQTPPSPMRRIVSNIEILGADETAGEYLAGSNFVLYELAVQSNATLRVWPGRATHRLRRVDGRLRMAQKIVELVTAGQAQFNLAFLI